MSRGQTAARVRAEKDAHPERFCTARGCLWRVATRDGANPCRNHARPALVDVLAARLEARGLAAPALEDEPNADPIR